MNLKKSSGAEKLLNYFDHLVKTSSFQKKILRIRKKYKIPVSGFEDETQKNWLPTQWVHHDNKKIQDKLYDVDIPKIIEKFALFGRNWDSLLWEYIFYNVYDHQRTFFIFPTDELCYLSDIQADKTECDLHLPEWAEEFQRIENELDKKFPILIRVSAYASQNDIRDFIQTNKDRILRIQEEHRKKGILLGKIRSKNPIIQERNQFIYENRNLKLKEITKLVYENFHEHLDEGNVGKIISEEERIRK